MDARADERWFFPGIALAISATAFAGFAITYLGPLATGAYPAVSWAVHAHGVVYLIWCALLPVQATLARRVWTIGSCWTVKPRSGPRAAWPTLPKSE